MAETLRDGLESFPEDAAVLCWLGVAERELGLEAVAYERFKACLALGPEDPHVLATAGNALAHVDDPEAEAALRAAVVMAPDLVLARLLYGAYLSREGLHDSARTELEAARRLDPENPAVHYELGVGLALAGDRAASIDALFAATELDPEDGWARVVLGLLLADESRFDEALTELDAGARLRAEDVEAQLVTAAVAAATEAPALAVEMVERARMFAEGPDRALVEEVDARVVGGPAAAGALLRDSLVPMVLRARLMSRP